MNATLQHLQLDEHLRDRGRKQRYVNTVFDIVASSYDRFTRLSSWGLDMTWKRDLVRLVKRRLAPSDVVVDLATGTGDLAFSLAPYVDRVIGIDISERMIALARQAQRIRKAPNVEFRVGDLMATGLAGQSVHAVTVSYGLRNCPDFRLGLAEIHRVLKPGGCLASLDFVRLEDPWQESLFENGLLLGCNVLGWLWHGEPAAYGYLARSIKYFATNQEFTRALRETGFHVVAERPKLAGALYLHLAERVRM
jgi:demethylmenaquinone methyltransferase/2-methoxy-6-polyprenyl-1,4-benzoquinol methylase